MKVRTTLIGGEKKMLVWNDLEADEKIKVYDKGVRDHQRRGRLELLVSYRSGDMWAPQVEQVEALQAGSSLLRGLHHENDKTPFNDGDAGLRVVRMLEAADTVADAERESRYACERISLRLLPTSSSGKDVKLSKFINLYGCEIGDNTKIGAFVEIQKNATVGRRCKISSHTFICEGVTIEDNVFVGHSVTFINDSYPRATTADGGLQTEERLEGRDDAREEGRLDRFWRNDSCPT